MTNKTPGELINDIRHYLEATRDANLDSTAEYARGVHDVSNGALGFIDLITGEWPVEGVPVPEPVVRVVEVNDQYTYTLYVDDLKDVRYGGTVDVEAKSGGHWSGKVTHVWPSVDDYLKDTRLEEPSLTVLEVIDPGPAAQ